MITVTDASGRTVCDATVAVSCGGETVVLPPLDEHGAEIDASAQQCFYGNGLGSGCFGSTTIHPSPVTVSVSKSGFETVTVPAVSSPERGCQGSDPPTQRIHVALKAG